jgi:DNA-binding response OmpR family regulator
MLVLIAEDEPKIAQSLQLGLEQAGFEVMLAWDGQMAQRLFTQQQVEFAILDVNLPYVNGFELCRQFKQQRPALPIMMLTALGDVDDKVQAFGAGADDYLVKPFHMQELLARVYAISKRYHAAEQPQLRMQVADLELDSDKKEVRRAGKLLRLSQKEYLLLETLMKARGRVLSKAELAERVWALDFDTGTNTVEVYINFLRNKIDKPFEQKLIHTRTGFGYYLKEEA